MIGHSTQRILVSYLSKASLQLQKPLHLERYLFVPAFTWQKRLTHKDVEISDHTCEITNYSDYRLNHKPIVQVIAQTLKEILNTQTYETNKILAANPQLKKRSRANILNNYYNLLDIGIQQSTIKKYAWLLAHEDTKLKEKIDCISTLNMNNEELVPWLRFTYNELVNIVNYVQTDQVPYMYNKIEHLAYRLECSIEELCELTVRCPFLLKIPVMSTDNKLNILHEYNISNRSLLKDPWVLRYSENHIRHRCELYKDTENLEVKTWAIRCPLKVVTRAIQKNYVKRNVLQNYSNIKDYLLNKLKIEEKQLNILISKCPTILRVNPFKLDKLIDMLHENGISSDEIIQMGGPIFYFNPETIQKRIEILNQRNIRVQIPTLKLSEKTFDEYLGKCEISERKKHLLHSHRNVKGYLMYRLKADEDVMEKFLNKWKFVQNVNILKIEEFINILHEYGFTNNDILTHGRIFNFKIDSIRMRLEVLKDVGLPLKITAVLFSQKCFDEYVKYHLTLKQCGKKKYV